MKKIFICLLFVLTVLAGIACVSAVDVDNTTSLTVDEVGSNLVLDNNVDNVSLLTNSSECGVVDNPANNSVNGTKLKITPPNINDLFNNKGPSITLDIHGPKMSKGGLALLQFKIDQASAGSTVYLDRNYTNNVANNIITINKDLVIDGQGHSVDFANLKNCYFKSTKGDLTVRNLIIKNGYNDDCGGAFYLNNKNLNCIFDNCSFINCWSQKSGGAIYAITDRVLSVKNCIFENNKIKKGDGGAICVKNAIMIESSVFKGNYADGYGGAVCSYDGSVYVSKSIFENNTATSQGGAIYAIKDIISTNCEYTMNINDVHKFTSTLKSKNGKVTTTNKGFNPVGDFDNINNVSLNKKNVSFWVKDSKSLKDIFNFIESKKPVWENIVLTLSPNTEYKADFSNQFGFSLHLNTHLTIMGQFGSVITGNNHKNSFIYIANTGALGVFNVTLNNFEHCFINRGSLYCNNTAFCDNEGKEGADITGDVIVNSGSAFFDHCSFSSKHALKESPILKGYGAVLYAFSHSLTVFSDCNFDYCRDDFICAMAYSTVVVRQKNKMGDTFKDCYFARTACFSVISSEIYNGNIVFNCSSVDQLQKALYIVNSFTPNVLSVVINLQSGVYVLDADWLNYKTNLMRSMNWRDEYYNVGYDVWKQKYLSEDYGNFDFYALDVGIVPIFLNGHNSTIKLINNNRHYEEHFAFIGYGGKLFVNNISFSNFNGVFMNYGSLNLINCIFTDNLKMSEYEGCGAVVHGVESTVNIIDCIFNNNNTAYEANTDIVNIVGGIVRFNDGCNFTNFFETKNIIGSVSHGGLIEAPEELKSKFVLKDSSTFKDYRTSENIYCFNITSNNYQSQMDYINNVTGLVILNLSDINKKGNSLRGLPSASRVLVLGNGAHISNGDFGNANKGTNINIAEYERYSFVNLTFSNYKKLMDNQGLCCFINCSFVNNACGDYLVRNNGSCSFINCKFINNKAKNLIFNDAGCISFDNCSFVNNSYSDKGLIYNKHGSIDMFNSSIINSGKITIYNFETKDCNVKNTTGCTEKYAETEQPKKSKWYTFWHISYMIGTFVCAAIAAYFTAGAILPGLISSCGALLGYTITLAAGAAVGALVGVAGAGLDYAILGSMYGHPDVGSLMIQYAKVGALGGVIGAFTYISYYNVATDFEAKMEQEIAENFFDGGGQIGEIPHYYENYAEQAPEWAHGSHIDGFTEESISEENFLDFIKKLAG